MCSRATATPMRGINNQNKTFTYAGMIFIMFLVRTAVLGIVLLKGSYFIIEEREKRTFKVFSILMDVVNIFLFIFILNVVEKKNLFQFLLYIPLLVYALMLTIILLFESYQLPENDQSTELYVGISFLFAYGGLLVLEMIFHTFMYNKLKNDFRWSNFKKIGVSPVVNGKVNNNFRGIQATRRVQCREAVFSHVSEWGDPELQHELPGAQVPRIHIHRRVAVRCLHDDLCISRGGDPDTAPEPAGIHCVVHGRGNHVCSVQHHTLLHGTPQEKVSGASNLRALVLESLFYVFNMVILLLSAYRDYQMFGSGLKDSRFRGRTVRMRSGIVH